MRTCREKYGDIPRFLTTAFVARDVDRIREALGEEKLTGFMISYGTGIGLSTVFRISLVTETRFRPKSVSPLFY